VSARERAIRAHRTLLSDGDKPSYFEERGVFAERLRAAWVGCDAASGAFTYPCIAVMGSLCRGPAAERTRQEAAPDVCARALELLLEASVRKEGGPAMTAPHLTRK
jgi:hypothetical protein